MWVGGDGHGMGMDGDGEGLLRAGDAMRCAQCARGRRIYIWQLVRSPWPGTRPNIPIHRPRTISLPITNPSGHCVIPYLTLPSSHLPRLLAVHPLLALRSAPYVLSARLSVTSPAPLPCDSTRHCPKRRVTLGRPVYYQSSTTSLHRGLLNSLHAASPLPQWTRKQR
jgi:hypothetical protein